MTTGWLLLLLLVVVSSQSVDSHGGVDHDDDDDDFLKENMKILLTIQENISQQLQLAMKRLGTLKADALAGFRTCSKI